jgi:hypothetical protein
MTVYQVVRRRSPRSYIKIVIRAAVIMTGIDSLRCNGVLPVRHPSDSPIPQLPVGRAKKITGQHGR